VNPGFPRQPLRYLLADDPGAGKTIMAGLLIKELLLRGDLMRCMVVSPGNLVEQWQDELDNLDNAADTEVEQIKEEILDQATTSQTIAELRAEIRILQHLEQRFGRIHRIGQTEVCHLWNIVDYQTQERDVLNACCPNSRSRGRI
jgi:SNF2 family DNA or RNA helicase